MKARRDVGRGGWRRLGICGVLVLLAGCSLLDPTDEDRASLEEARTRWESLALDRYTYLVRRACECLPETTGPFEVRVRPGEEPTVIRPETGEALEPPVSDAFPSVQGLFALVDDALRRGAHRVDVEYDRSTGTPLRLSIDYDEQVADEELLYWSTVPEPLE